MAFTISSVITRAKRRLRIEGDTSHDDDFLDWVNDFHAILYTELASLNHGWTEVTGYVDTVANQYSYTIPSNILFVTSVKYKYNDIYYEIPEMGVLKHIDYDPSSPITNAIGGYFFQGNDTIKLRGAPDVATTNGLEVSGYPDTTDSESGDSISWNNFVRLLYVLYLCKTYRDSDQDETVNKFDAEYQGKMMLFRQVMTQRGVGLREIGYDDEGFQT